VYLKDKAGDDEYEALKEIILEYLELTTYEISIPSLRDETMSPSGKTGVIVSTLMEYDVFKQSIEKGWYENLKSFCVNSILKVLDRSIFPGILEKTINTICATPVTIENVTKGLEGSITGWAYSLNMPVQSSMTKIASSVETDIKDVFKAGQWAFYPSGLPTCIITGKLAADKVIKKIGKKS
jgi:phytoene dehydrogenase-like protein